MKKEILTGLSTLLISGCGSTYLENHSENANIFHESPQIQCPVGGNRWTEDLILNNHLYVVSIFDIECDGKRDYGTVHSIITFTFNNQPTINAVIRQATGKWTDINLDGIVQPEEIEFYQNVSERRTMNG